MSYDDARRWSDEDLLRLIADGYRQTSAKYRTLARLPPGMSAVDAMVMSDPRSADDWRKRGEESCGRQWRCVYASSWKLHDLEVVLPPADFKAYKKLGGGIC